MGMTQSIETDVTVASRKTNITVQFARAESLLLVLGGRPCDKHISEDVLAIVREIFAGVHRVDSSQANLKASKMLINLALFGYAHIQDILDETEERNLETALNELNKLLSALLEPSEVSETATPR
jgi:hypothetical protein